MKVKPGDIVYYATYTGVGTARLDRCRVEEVGRVDISSEVRPAIIANLYVLNVPLGKGIANRFEQALTESLAPTFRDGILQLVESIECERQSILASIEVLQEQCEALEAEKAFVAMFEGEEE